MTPQTRAFSPLPLREGIGGGVLGGESAPATAAPLRTPPPTPSRKGRGRRGFTLIEAMAALVLVGIVLPIAMQGISMALQTTSRADHLAEAVELCRSKLAEVSAAADPSNFATGGQFPDQPAYSWQTTYTTRDDGTDEITCTVTWQQADGQRSTSLVTLAYPAGNSTTASSGSTQ